MRRANFIVFDDFVPTGAHSTAFFTSQDFNSTLGQFDQMAIQVVIDNVTGTGGFDLFVMHSADGRTFKQVNGTSTTGDVTISALSSGSVGSAWGFPNIGGTPTTGLLGFVQFKMKFGDDSTAGQVRVYVTQRDQA